MYFLADCLCYLSLIIAPYMFLPASLSDNVLPKAIMLPFPLFVPVGAACRLPFIRQRSRRSSNPAHHSQFSGLSYGISYTIGTFPVNTRRRIRMYIMISI